MCGCCGGISGGGGAGDGIGNAGRRGAGGGVEWNLQVRLGAGLAAAATASPSDPRMRLPLARKTCTEESHVRVTSPAGIGGIIAPTPAPVVAVAIQWRAGGGNDYRYRPVQAL